MLTTALGIFGLLVLVRFNLPEQHIEPITTAQVIPPAQEPKPAEPLDVSAALRPASADGEPDTAPPATPDSEALLSEPLEPEPLPALIGTEDNTEVWLTQGERRFALGEVPAGRYQIQAVFSGEAIHAGDVSLRAGEQVKLRCDEYFQQCRRKEP